MTKTYKKISNLHRLIESARLTDLQALLAQPDDNLKKAIEGFSWPTTAPDDAQVRDDLIAHFCALSEDLSVPAEQMAQRIVPLCEGRGAEVVEQVIREIKNTLQRDQLRNDFDSFGRVLWLFVNDASNFEQAEWLLHADRYRNHGKMYAAFEVQASDGAPLEWSSDVQAALVAQIQKELELTEPCAVIHHIIHEAGHGNGSREPVERHMLIIRHNGPLTSEPVLKAGRKDAIYFHKLNEASLIFSPGLVEVFAPLMGTKQKIAAAFATSVLKQDLSKKPLLQKQYNLSRLLGSLTLSVPEVDGLNVASAKIVEVTAKPRNPRHSISLKVGEDDDIDDAARQHLGQHHFFRHAAAISRVVVMVGYSKPEILQTRTLNITVSEPNHCNLQSNVDPLLREAGFSLLQHWGVLTRVRPLTPAEERVTFPALLELYDHRQKEISGQMLVERGIDPGPLLVEGGFMIRRGHAKSIAITLDDGSHQDVEVRAASQPGQIAYTCPKSNQELFAPASWADIYELKREWIAEKVMKGLMSALKPSGNANQEHELIDLGQLRLGDQSVPCHFAFGLSDPKIFRRIDEIVRTRTAGAGIVLSASRNTHADFIGPHVLLWAGNFLSQNSTDIVYDIAQIGAEYTSKRLIAASAQKPELLANPHGRSWILILPGAPDPFTVTGRDQPEILRRLIKAYPNPVATKDLMDSLGSNNPAQAFKGNTWRKYVVAAKRGFWKLNC